MREAIGIKSETDSSRFPAKPVETLSADRVITVDEINKYQAFAFDPAGARNVDLPAEAASKGAVVFISNEANAAEIITVRDDGGATLATPTQNEAGVFWCDGTTWYGFVGASS